MFPLSPPLTAAPPALLVPVFLSPFSCVCGLSARATSKASQVEEMALQLTSKNNPAPTGARAEGDTAPPAPPRRTPGPVLLFLDSFSGTLGLWSE